jgi:GNAT superfamily N-acetyltransferase
VEFRKETMDVADLAVSPQYQRMGVGRKLLDWSLPVADDRQLYCWIDASPRDLGLYRQLGRIEVGKLEFDPRTWEGGKETSTPRFAWSGSRELTSYRQCSMTRSTSSTSNMLRTIASV